MGQHLQVFPFLHLFILLVNCHCRCSKRTPFLLTLCSSLPLTALFSVPLKISHAPTAAPDFPIPEDTPSGCKKTLWRQLTTVASERSGPSFLTAASLPKTCILLSSPGAAATVEVGLFHHICGVFICSLARVLLPCSQLIGRHAHRAALWDSITCG